MPPVPDTLPLMSDYRIEKVRHRVTVTLTTGQTLEGDIFLQAFARFRAGPEQPIDALNDADDFIPLVSPSGVLVLQKSQIAMVVTEMPASEADVEAGFVGMNVEVTLTGGITRTGSVFPELRADRPRLVDFLNDTRLRFLPMFAGEHLLLVSRTHIAYARPIS